MKVSVFGLKAVAGAAALAAAVLTAATAQAATVNFSYTGSMRDAGVDYGLSISGTLTGDYSGSGTMFQATGAT